MNAITVNDLYNSLKKAIDAGFGDKKILLSNDDEGNGYHECFFVLTSDIGSFGFGDRFAPSLPFNVSPEDAEKNYVIIG